MTNEPHNLLGCPNPTHRTSLLAVYGISITTRNCIRTLTVKLKIFQSEGFNVIVNENICSLLNCLYVRTACDQTRKRGQVHFFSENIKVE